MLNKLKGIHKAVTDRRQSADTNQYLVGLDIGTEYVKALIGRISGDDIEIIGVGRAHQALADMQAGAISDITAVVQNCESALAQAEQQAGVSSRTVVIGIAGELVKGTTITVKCNRQSADIPLDIDEVSQIISLVQDKAAEKAKKQLFLDMGGKDVEIRLVNSALVSIEIDGYPVTNPLGFQGKEVVVELYTAFAPMIHIGALERTAVELDLDLLAVAAEPFAVARSVIGNDPNQNKSAILMDVGGGTTDIAIVHEGGVQGTEMFGIGGRAFTRAIEREKGIDFTEAEKLKLKVDSNTIPEHHKASIEDALQKTLDVWMSGIDLALGEFDGLDYLPHQLLLCGGGSSLSLLVDRLKRESWYSDLAFTKRPQIKHIDPKQVYGIKDATGDVADHTFITAMGLLRVGLDTLQQQEGKDTGTIRQKIDRMLRV
jgi:cell division protein FtsA